jgi:hypothetical protein
MEQLWVSHLMMTWATVKLATMPLELVAFLLNMLLLSVYFRDMISILYHSVDT